MADLRIPVATYRLQFNRAFTFSHAKSIVPYLYELGISDIYASPLLKTSPHSSSGYDVCDHSRLNPALGSDDDFEAFASALRTNGQGLILDIVPNHMGIGETCNAWWMDVLENGPSSSYASYFDIDWQPVNPHLENKVLLPILEDQYGNVLEEGKLRLTYEDGAFFIAYHDTKLPVAPRTYSTILGYRLDHLADALGRENECVKELQSILTAIGHLPLRTEADPEKLEERKREKEIIKRRIASLYQASPQVRDAVEMAVREFNGAVGDPRSFDMLDDLVNAQPYRLAFWRVAGEEINYRRFFDINELAAIRMELPEVFRATHELVLRLLAEGKATGLRIDHPDGLWDPAGYFRQLEQSYGLQSLGAARWAPDRNRNEAMDPPWPLYVIAEKILSKGESLPEDWAVCGTTGYDFLNTVNGIFVDHARRKLFDKVYGDFIGSEIDFRNLVNSTKKMIMLVSLASEINSLSHQLDRISERNRHYRDFTLNSLTFAIREVIACLSIYRTYNHAVTGTVSERDAKYIEAAVEEAKKRNPRTARALFDFIRDTLLLRNLLHFREEDRRHVIDFVMEFQQLTGPVMAKAVEDTAFYVYNRLISLNEVGGDPEQFGLSLEAFHQQNSERLRQWPHSMLATSTHDTKRSEDVRARINVLSEIPVEWRSAVMRWSGLNAAKKSHVDGAPAPDRNDEYLLYQTLVGAWPVEPHTPEEFADFRKRIVAYMQKAINEAKVHTSWVNPNESYDQAVTDFVRDVLAPDAENRFLSDFVEFHSRIAHVGMLNSLSQTLLKITSPGVPDFYQGTELWDFSLVDPDNRRPVDFDQRRKRLDELKRREGRDALALVKDLLSHWQDGRVKLYLIYKALNFRRTQSLLFQEGEYIPIYASGKVRENICAFARGLGSAWVLVAVPRLTAKLVAPGKLPLGGEAWGESDLVLPHRAPKRWLNVFTGEELEVSLSERKGLLRLASLCQSFPVALLAPLGSLPVERSRSG
ncbi:MAG: malto-oligosyltrehalose synthase [Deltaproteobacteria bacterium]|nr:malto-oligosyltrehalose synthase [Deltaproteobacteria bacterium]